MRHEKFSPETTILFFPAPGGPAGPVKLHLYPTRHESIGRAWRAMREVLAADLRCDESDLSTDEVYWGGAHDDEESTEIVRLNGRIIGALGRDLTARDIAAIDGAAPIPLAAE